MDISSIYLRTQDIRSWAEQRNLIAGSSPADQYLKLMKGCGQLLVAISKDDVADIKNGIGGMFVALTILAAQCGYRMELHFQRLIDHDVRRAMPPPVVESLGKLAAELHRGQYDRVMEPILDALCAMMTISGSRLLGIGECVEAAWREIKDHKGKMENDRPSVATGAY